MVPANDLLAIVLNALAGSCSRNWAQLHVFLAGSLVFHNRIARICLVDHEYFLELVLDFISSGEAKPSQESNHFVLANMAVQIQNQLGLQRDEDLDGGVFKGSVVGALDEGVSELGI